LLWQNILMSVKFLSKLKVLGIGSTIFFVAAGSCIVTNVKPAEQIAGAEFTTANAPRGISGDLWADKEVGKRDFTEDAPREVVDYKVSAPGGVIVDRSVSPGRMYVWDSGNSRIIGVDLGGCYSGGPPCHSSIVLGQPSLSDHGACNQDASFQNYPTRAPSSASTICGIPEWTHTTLEDKTFSSMYVDGSGDLYVADVMNNRVLRFDSPFTTDTIADDVWGQANFTENRCNHTTNYAQASSQPTAASFCFQAVGGGGSGVTFDSAGNMWVADGGNNRVLRFPNSGGTISKTANLVLGQTNFTTGGDYSGHAGNTGLSSPDSLAFGDTGKLYIADVGNNRVQVFTPPFSNHMAATGNFGSYSSLASVQIDPDGSHIWTYENVGFTATLKRRTSAAVIDKTLPGLGNPGGGSIGFDNSGNVLVSTYVYGQDIHRFHPSGANYTHDMDLFEPPWGYNLTTSRRFEHGAWEGVAVDDTQLVVTDGRLLFWNNVSTLNNGDTPDGYAGASTFTNIPSPGYTLIKSDNANRIWAPRGSTLEIFHGPLSTGETPFKTITSPIALAGGGTTTFGSLYGVAPQPDGDYVWVTDTDKNRVLRIRDPLGTPVVDVILGQTSSGGTQCNRNVIPQPNSGTSLTAGLDMLCVPGAISLDRFNNLYVSDHFIESAGNWRLLMFSESMFPASINPVLYAPSATKSFPRVGGSNNQAHATFETAFSSENKMVVGYNPYLGPRFIEYYNNPTSVNPSDPSDPNYAKPDGHFNDFFNWAVGMTFDKDDNLYAFDNNRGRVMIYKQPFGAAVDTPTPTPTETNTPTPTNSPVPGVSATPTPTGSISPSGTVSPTQIPGTTATPTPTPTRRPPTGNILLDNPITVAIDQLFGGVFLGNTGSNGNGSLFLPSVVSVISGEKLPMNVFELFGLVLVMGGAAGIFIWKLKNRK